ncbi:15990_t:CDS:2, partial [Dentiscutata erythropus]
DYNESFKCIKLSSQGEVQNLQDGNSQSARDDNSQSVQDNDSQSVQGNSLQSVQGDASQSIQGDKHKSLFLIDKAFLLVNKLTNLANSSSTSLANYRI